jgi:hypothetical protein
VSHATDDPLCQASSTRCVGTDPRFGHMTTGNLNIRTSQRPWCTSSRSNPGPSSRFALRARHRGLAGRAASDRLAEAGPAELEEVADDAEHSATQPPTTAPPPSLLKCAARKWRRARVDRAPQQAPASALESCLRGYRLRRCLCCPAEGDLTTQEHVIDSGGHGWDGHFRGRVSVASTRGPS